MTLSGATTLGQSEPGSNGNEGMLQISKIFKEGALSSEGLMSKLGHTFSGEDVLHHFREAVGVFYRPS